MRRARKARRTYCKDCVYLKVRLDREGRAAYWCILRQEDLGQRVMWKRACKDFAGNEAKGEFRREVP